MPVLEIHGTPDYAELRELGLTPDDVVIFSSNINPYGPPPAVVEAVQSAATSARIALYPDRFSHELRVQIAAYHHVSVDHALVGNGTADIMWLLALAFARGRRAAIVAPTFSEYENSLSLMDAESVPICHPGWRTENGRYIAAATTVSDTARALEQVSPDLVFICNPNNPTGGYLSPQEMQQMHGAAPDALWVVDEAYAEFVQTPWSAASWVDGAPWIVLRSMTKDFALGGLRLGYLIARPDLVEILQRAQPPWNVNVLAQEAGLAALGALDWRRHTTALLRSHCDDMQQALRLHGFSPHPSAANYFLLPVSQPAKLVRRTLLQRRLIVRDCTSFGLPSCIRIAVQRPEQNQRLVEALAAVI